MNILTLIRVVAWFGVFIVFWSLNVKWGTDPNIGNSGPPGNWERQVVGSGLLAFIGAIALTFSGRGGNPPSWRARSIALGAAVLIIVIAMLLRREALAAITGADPIAGPGWAWLLAGGGFLLSASTFAMALTTRRRGSRPEGESTEKPKPGHKPAKKSPAQKAHARKSQAKKARQSGKKKHKH
jgi:hypothetical protein